mgnify:CR=1 FL=1
MKESVQKRLTRGLGSRPVSWKAPQGGYTRAQRWITTLADGRSAFVKLALDPLTAGWLRDEMRMYHTHQLDILPRLLWWDDDPQEPMLVIEDLSAMTWTEAWTPARVEAVQETLRTLNALAAPKDTPSMTDKMGAMRGWPQVAQDPEPFLSTAVASQSWLERALPTLMDVDRVKVLQGDALCHLDVRSDNLCFRPDGRAILVDWNFACTGNARIDLAAWAPSLHMQGGPPPETLLPHAPAEAAFISGYFASVAGLDPATASVKIRALQRNQLKVALPWACRALELPPPDLLD